MLLKPSLTQFFWLICLELLAVGLTIPNLLANFSHTFGTV